MDKVYALLAVGEIKGGMESESWIALEISPALRDVLDRADQLRAQGAREVVLDLPLDARWVSDDTLEVLQEAGYEPAFFLGQCPRSPADVAAEVLGDEVGESERHLLRACDVAALGAPALSTWSRELDLAIHVRAGDARFQVGEEHCSWWQNRARDLDAVLAAAAGVRAAAAGPAPGCG